MRFSAYSRRNAALLLPVLLACAGCNETGNSYVIELTPAENGLERRVSVHSYFADSKPLPARIDSAEADRLERLYGERPDTLRMYSVRRHFDDIPEDIGNWGAYRAGRSLLGSSAVYVERFRGNVHAAEIVGPTLAKADSLFALVQIWCAAELARQPGWPALQSYLETEVHTRLRDYASSTLLANYMPGRSGEDPFVLMPYEHPELTALLMVGIDLDAGWITFFSPTSALDSLRVRFARALDLRTPAESQRVLAFLADRRHAEASMVRAVGAARNLPPDEALTLWNSTLVTLFYQFGGGQASSDSLEVRLATGFEPYSTNGEWDAESGRVVWRAGIPGPREGARSLPYCCSAYWSIPDSVRQNQLFGRTLLDGDDLATYCGYFTSLDAKHQQEWDRALLSLKPGRLSRLERFRFADERARGMAAGDSTGLSYPLTHLILDAAQEELEAPPP